MERLVVYTDEVRGAVARALESAAQMLFDEARDREQSSKRPAATASAIGIKWAAVKLEQLAQEVRRG
jgi:hypothetical protein